MSELNVPLTEHEVSATLDPTPHNPPAGDWTDDDGLAIDDYLRTRDPGPVDQFTAVPLPAVELPKPQRILRARYNLQSPNQGGPAQAVRAFPVDPNRTKLKITEFNNNGFYFHSEPFTVVDTATAGVAQTAAFFVAGTTALPGGPVLELDNYTGAIYVNSRFDGPAVIEILCVTS